MPATTPDPLNQWIGRNIRMLRVKARLSQSVLGARIGLTFQQVQKYESGANRVSGSCLWRISQALGVPIGAFFEGAEAAGEAVERATAPPTLATERQAARLVRAYSKLTDLNLRRLLVELVEDAATKAKPS